MFQLYRHRSMSPHEKREGAARHAGPLSARSKFALSSFVAAVFLLWTVMASAQTKSMQQLLSEHIDLRFGMFIHFNMNTFFPGWGEPRTDPRTFNPTALDCNQWARAARSAGIKYALLTTKHHDGFSIWPSQQVPPNGLSPYTIAQSSVPTRDVVREYVNAFREQGILPGLYFSMWDVANVGGTYQAPGYSDTGPVSWPQVRTFILGQITELLGGTYGEIPIFVIDGYSWSMGHRQVPYQEIHDLIKRLQPNCLIVDHNGGLPWEVDVVYFEEPIGVQAPAGNTTAACQGQTISSDWFWNASATDAAQLLSVTDIVNNHLRRLEPLYTNFILNCPPNRSGLLDQAIVDRLAELGAMWSPDPARAPLPTQLPKIETPMTPASAVATSGNASLVIDNLNDFSGGPRSQTLWQSTGALPQSVTLDLGSVRDNVDMLQYLSRREPGNTSGNITSYRVYVSTDNAAFTQVASGNWPASPVYRGLISPQRVQFPPQSARYVRLEATAVASGTIAIAGEVAVGTSDGTINDGGPKLDGGPPPDSSGTGGDDAGTPRADASRDGTAGESSGAGGSAPTTGAGGGPTGGAGPGGTASGGSGGAGAADAGFADATPGGATGNAGPSAGSASSCNCATRASRPELSWLFALVAAGALGRRRARRAGQRFTD